MVSLWGMLGLLFGGTVLVLLGFMVGVHASRSRAIELVRRHYYVQVQYLRSSSSRLLCDLIERELSGKELDAHQIWDLERKERERNEHRKQKH